MIIRLQLRVALRLKATFYSCPIFLLLFSLQGVSQTGDHNSVASAGLHDTLSPTARNFIPASTDINILSGLLNSHETSYRNTLAALPKDYKKDFDEVYGLRWKNINEKFELGEVYSSATAQKYLDEVVNEIRVANTCLTGKQFRCYFSRSGIPNASSLGEGVILINMGLVSKLQNESQLAFVICHEIAHYYLKHSDNAINTYVSRINSREYQNELRDIKNSTYGKRERLEQLTKKYSFDSRRHTRQSEMQADSFALVLMRQSGFNSRESLTALALLDTIDTDAFDVETSLATTFNSTAYPFQKRWLKKEQGLLGGHVQLREETWADSLKTHPDCSKRIAALNTWAMLSGTHGPGLSLAGTGPGSTSVTAPVTAGASPNGAASTGLNPKDAGTQTDPVNKRLFNELQKDFRYEVIEFEFDSKNYTRTLFYSLQLLEENNQDVYLVNIISKCLNSIFQAYKGHQLSKVTDLPSPGYSVKYNVLCQFIQNLYPENIANINYQFLLKHKQNMAGSTEFANSLNEAMKAIGK